MTERALECVCCDEYFEPEENKIMLINCLHNYCTNCLEDVKKLNSENPNGEKQRCRDCLEIIQVWSVSNPSETLQEIELLDQDQLLEKKKFFVEHLEKFENDRTAKIEQHNNDSHRLLQEMKENVDNIKQQQTPEKIKQKMYDFYQTTTSVFLNNHPNHKEQLQRFFDNIEQNCGGSDLDNKKATAYLKEQQLSLDQNDEVNIILFKFIKEFLDQQEEFDNREPILHADADKRTEEDAKKVELHLDKVLSYQKRITRAIFNMKSVLVLINQRLEFLDTHNPAKKAKPEQ